MTKLPKNTLQDISISKIKTLFKENKDILDFKDYVRDYIESALQEENKQKFAKEDFEILEGFIEVKESYAIMLRKINPDFSYELLDILSKGQTLEEFETFINKDNIKSLIKYGKSENIKLFFGEDFYNIKNKEDLENLFVLPNTYKILDLIKDGKVENIKIFFGKDGIIKNRKYLEKLFEDSDFYEIMNLIKNWKIENIKLFFGEDFYNIKDRKDLEELFKNPNIDTIIDLIEYCLIENIKLFFGKDLIIKDKNDLEELFKNPYIKKIIDLLRFGESENIKIFFGENFYNIKNRKDLEDLFKNPNIDKIIDLIEYGPIENIKIFFGENGIIKNTEDLENLFENSYFDKIRDLIRNGKIENIKIFFSEDFYNIKNIEELVNGFKNSYLFKTTNINKVIDLIKTGELENIKLFFGENGIIKNRDDLEEFFRNPCIKEIMDLIKTSNIENIKIFFGEDFYNIKNIKNIEDLEELFKNPYIKEIMDLIRTGKTENIKLFFGKDLIIKDKKDLEELFKNPYIKEIMDLIRTGKTENIKLFFGEDFYNIKDRKDLNKLFSSSILIYPYFFKEIDEVELEKFYNCFTNGFSKKNIGDAYDLLFPIESKGSKVFDEIKEKMSENENKDMYEILRETANKFLDKQKLSKQETLELELAIYLRYEHTVDYPEIGELIIIFMQELIKRNGIKGVKGIKILPREKYILPRGNILDENTRFLNVSGKDFVEEFNTNSIPFYLSHSSNQSNGLAVVSGSMNQNKGQLNLGLELEKEYDRLATDEKSINDIFNKLVRIIGKINKI